MNDLLARLDKYKYGLFTMVAFYVIVSSIRVQYGYVARPDISHLLNKKADDVIELKLEPLEMVEMRMEATGEVKNAARNEQSSGSSDNSSTGGSSDRSYSSSRSLADVEQSVYDLERALFEEAGGAVKRAEIQGEMDKRKKAQEEAEKSKAAAKSTASGTNSVGNSSEGKVLVSYSLKSRNGTYVPAPGYMCPQGTSGKVIIAIKVDQAGKVVEAKPAPGSATDGCMVSYAIDFAKKSKFNYSATAGATQDGTITYTFVN